jgi:iron complex outermembrane receptor protein
MSGSHIGRQQVAGAKTSAAVRAVLCPVVTAAVMAFGLMSQASAQTASAATATPTTDLTEIVVTGSLIRRTDTETPSPVQVLSAEDIAKSGYTSIADVLHNLSANGAGSLNQAFNGAFAGGGSGIALRGLSVGATLTLIDGHRMVGYPLTDDGERNFVDVTAIPINAVERIEVLKDGASAEYGSDAIAGVVNVILKKTYTGAEITADGGTSSHNDGTTAHAAAIWGTGDLAQDGWNFYTSAEYRHQDAIPFVDRHGDYTNLNYQSSGGLNINPGAGSNPNVAFPGSTTGYLIDPVSGAPGAFFPGCTAAGQAADQCTYQNKGLQLQPSGETASVLSKFTVNLGGDWKSTTTASVFINHSEQPGAGYASTAFPSPAIIALPPGGAPAVTIIPSFTVPAGYPGNPYGQAAPLIYNFTELGFPYTTFESSTYRFVEDVDGKIAGWDIGTSAGYMYAHLRQDSHGLINAADLQTALNNNYVLGSSSGPSLFSPVQEATDASYLFFVNAHAAKGLFELPSGKDLSVAFGAEWNEKKLNATAAQGSLDGTVLGLNDAFALGSQSDTGAFVEVDAPIIKGLEANAALRYDHYNTNAGGAVTPKFGLKYSPIDMLTVRGTWGKGFRAPSIAENNSGLAFLAGTTPDPLLCGDGKPATAGNFPSQCNVALVGVQPGNPDLKPEKSTNYTFGVLFEPSRMFNMSVDYYDIKITQDIISAFEAFGLGLNVTTPLERLGPLVTLPQTQANGSLAPVQTPVPLITFESFPYINASQSQTNGVDLDMHSQFDAGIVGNFSAELSFTHMLTYKLEAGGSVFELAGTHGPSGVSGDTGNPKDRGTLVLGWEKGPIEANVNINYVGGFSITDPSAGVNTCAAAVGSALTVRYLPGTPFPPGDCRVASFTDVDLHGKFSFNDHFSVHAAVFNVLDKAPPFDVVTYGGGAGAAYSTLDQAGAVGRFFSVGATYKF